MAAGPILAIAALGVLALLAASGDSGGGGGGGSVAIDPYKIGYSIGYQGGVDGLPYPDAKKLDESAAKTSNPAQFKAGFDAGYAAGVAAKKKGGGGGGRTNCVSADLLKTSVTVKEVQGLLIKAGYSVGSTGADGDCGPATDKAIKAFQKDHGFTQTGVVGVPEYGILKTGANPVNNVGDAAVGAAAGIADAQSSIAACEYNGGASTTAITTQYMGLKVAGKWSADAQKGYVTAFNKTLVETAPGYEMTGDPVGTGATIKRKGGGGGDVTETDAAALGTKDGWATVTRRKAASGPVQPVFTNRDSSWSDDVTNAYDSAWASVLMSNGMAYTGEAVDYLGSYE